MSAFNCNSCRQLKPAHAAAGKVSGKPICRSCKDQRDEAMRIVRERRAALAGHS